ncbi:MAG: cell division protein FtsH, partial [Myxococcota bacterium]
MRQSHKTILLWVLLILMFVSVYNLITDSSSGEEKISTNEFKQALIVAKESRENPERATTHELLRDLEEVKVETGRNDTARYVLIYGDNKTKVVSGEYKGNIEDLLTQANIKYTVEAHEESTFWTQLIISWLPMIFLFVIFFFFMRQLQSGGGKAMSFGKSKAKLLTDHQNKITFKDVAGVEEAKDEVEEIIAFLKDPKKFTRLGGRSPKGVLMMGPPGTG